MNKLLALLGIFCLIGLVGAAIYQEPWIQNQLGDMHNLTDMDWISAENINGSNLFGTFGGDVNWTSLQNYPSACPGSGAVTTLDDSVTCSDLWLDVAGESMAGNINMGTNNITNATSITTTDLVATNLESNLNGSGYNITVDNVFGTVNATTWWAGVSGYISKWFYNSGDDLMLNETQLNISIDAKIASTTYNATSITTIEGTLDDGNLASIQVINQNSYNVSEDAGGSPLLISINFTGVEGFSNILLRQQYIGGLGHEIEIQTWNYDSSSWEVHGDITDQSTMVESVINVLDSSDHISGGLVQLRFDHQQNGNSGHDFRLDYIALQQGFTSITSAEHDGLLGRDEIENHPWALPTNGSLRNASSILVTNNITATWFLGNTAWSQIQDKFITAVDNVYIYMSGTTATFNETKLNFSIEAYGYSTEAGTVTSVATDNTYLTGGAITTTGTITLNETVLNTSIRAIDTVTNTSMKNYVDGTVADYLPLAGGTMAGIINMGSGNITAVECIVFDSGGSICTGV